MRRCYDPTEFDLYYLIIGISLPIGFYFYPSLFNSYSFATYGWGGDGDGDEDYDKEEEEIFKGLEKHLGKPKSKSISPIVSPEDEPDEESIEYDISEIDTQEVDTLLTKSSKEIKEAVYKFIEEKYGKEQAKNLRVGPKTRIETSADDDIKKFVATNRSEVFNNSHQLLLSKLHRNEITIVEYRELFQKLYDSFFNPKLEFNKLKDNSASNRVKEVNKVVVFLNKIYSRTTKSKLQEFIKAKVYNSEYLTNLGINQLDIETAFKSIDDYKLYYTDVITIFKNLTNIVYHRIVESEELNGFEESGKLLEAFRIVKSIYRDYIIIGKAIKYGEWVRWFRDFWSFGRKYMDHVIPFNPFSHFYEYLTIKGNVIRIGYELDGGNLHEVLTHLQNFVKQHDLKIKYLSFSYWTMNNEIRQLKTNILENNETNTKLTDWSTVRNYLIRFLDGKLTEADITSKTSGSWDRSEDIGIVELKLILSDTVPQKILSYQWISPISPVIWIKDELISNMTAPIDFDYKPEEVDVYTKTIQNLNIVEIKGSNSDTSLIHLKDIENLERTVWRKYIFGSLDIECVFVDKDSDILIPVTLVYTDDTMYPKSREFFGNNCILEFLVWMENHQEKYRDKFIIYAHNGSKFDFTYIVETIMKSKYKKKFSVNNVKSSWTTIKGWKKVTIADSYKILPEKLAKLSKTFLNKDITAEYKDNFMLTLDGSNYSLYESKLIDYCRQDTIVLYEIMKKYQDTLKGLTLSLSLGNTTPQIAYHSWMLKDGRRYVYPGQDQIIERPNVRKYTMDMNTYQGAIVDVGKSLKISKHLLNDINNNEVVNRVLELDDAEKIIFNSEQRKIQYMDVVSSYPYSMFIQEFPIGFSKILTREEIDNLNNTIPKDLIGTYYVLLKAPKDIKVPVIYSNIQGVMKPWVTTNKVWLNSLDLNYAIQNGYEILHIYEAKVWGKKDHIFVNHINDWFKVKKEAPKGDPRREVAKLMLNSLYGIFGISRNDIRLVYVEEVITDDYLKFFAKYNIHLERGTVNKISKDNILIIKELLRQDPVIDTFVTILNTTLRLHDDYYLAPIISSLITSSSRQIITEGIKAIGPENFIYCDTDSLLFESFKENNPHFKIGKDLGNWENEIKEGSEIIAVAVLAPKTYAVVMDNRTNKDGKQPEYEIEIKHRAKGLKADDMKFKTYKEFIVWLHQEMDKPINSPNFGSFIRKLLFKDTTTISQSREGLKINQSELKITTITKNREIKQIGSSKRIFTGLNTWKYIEAENLLETIKVTKLNKKRPVSIVANAVLQESLDDVISKANDNIKRLRESSLDKKEREEQLKQILYAYKCKAAVNNVGAQVSKVLISNMVSYTKWDFNEIYEAVRSTKAKKLEAVLNIKEGVIEFKEIENKK